MRPKWLMTIRAALEGGAIIRLRSKKRLSKERIRKLDLRIVLGQNFLKRFCFDHFRRAITDIRWILISLMCFGQILWKTQMAKENILHEKLLIGPAPVYKLYFLVDSKDHSRHRFKVFYIICAFISLYLYSVRLSNVPLILRFLLVWIPSRL